MSEHQIKEQQDAQATFAHNLATQPAVLVNGFSLSTIGRMPRLTFTEGIVPNLSPYVRAAVTMHPEDLAALVRGAQELLGKMQEAGLWTPPAAAITNGVDEEPMGQGNLQ